MPRLTLGALDNRDFDRAIEGSGLYLRTRPFVARIRTRLKSVKQGLKWLYADYEVTDENEAADMVIELDNPSRLRRFVGRQALAYVDAPSPFTPLPLNQAPLMLEMSLNWCVAMRVYAYMIFHSAVAERGGKAVLIPGESGQGKTTLSASLMLRGWRLLSDEFGLFDLDSGQLVPYPRPLSIKNESIDVLKRFSDAALFTNAMAGTPKGTLAYLRPSEESIARSAEPAELGCVIIPEFAPDKEPAFKRLEESRALFELTRSSVNYGKFGERSFRILTDLVLRVPTYVMRYPNLETAGDMIEEITC